jgi:hypothetical protein
MAKIEAVDCEATPSPPPELCIRLPFGLEFCSGKASAFGFEGMDRQLLSLVGILQPIMSPMMMILTLASVVKALIDCVKAIPESIASFSPGPIIDCLEKLAKVFPLLTKFIPPLTFIPMIVDIVRAVVLLVDTIIASIELTYRQIARGLQFNLDVEVIPNLSQYQDCIDDEINATLDKLAAMLNTSGPLFAIIATFLDLLGLAGLGKFVEPLQDIANTLSGATRDNINAEFIEDLRDIREILQSIESALSPFGGGGGSIGTIDLSG